MCRKIWCDIEFWKILKTKQGLSSTIACRQRDCDLARGGRTARRHGQPDLPHPPPRPRLQARWSLGPSLPRGTLAQRIPPCPHRTRVFPWRRTMEAIWRLLGFGWHPNWPCRSEGVGPTLGCGTSHEGGKEVSPTTKGKKKHPQQSFFSLHECCMFFLF